MFIYSLNASQYLREIQFGISLSLSGRKDRVKGNFSVHSLSVPWPSIMPSNVQQIPRKICFTTTFPPLFLQLVILWEILLISRDERLTGGHVGSVREVEIILYSILLYSPLSLEGRSGRKEGRRVEHRLAQPQHVGWTWYVGCFTYIQMLQQRDTTSEISRTKSVKSKAEHLVEDGTERYKTFLQSDCNRLSDSRWSVNYLHDEPCMSPDEPVGF